MKHYKKIALFDIDDTIYNGGIIFPLMEFQVKNNLLPKKYLDKVYEQKTLYQRGGIKYEELSKAVVTAWAEGLQGVSVSTVTSQAEKFIIQDSRNFFRFTSKILALLEKTHDAFIITNEPQFVATAVLKIFGFTDSISTIFETENGLFSGEISRFNSTRKDKKNSLYEILKTYDHNQSFAFGDSIGDVGMFEEVDYPICVNSSPELQTIATQRGWRLTDSDHIIGTVSELLLKP